MTAAVDDYTNVPNWRPATTSELRAFLGEMGEGREKKKKPKAGLIVRDRLNTLDAYTYLKARFGEPNGIQTMFAADDSDNLFHWDYMLFAGDRKVVITGASREVHLWLDDELADADWLRLIGAIKADFHRVGQDKSNVLQSLERWNVIPNKYAQIAEQCAEKHDNITSLLSDFEEFRPSSEQQGGLEDVGSRLSARSIQITSSALELRLLTPIMAEAFINLLILILVKSEIRSNPRLYAAFLRSDIDVRVVDLFYKCDGFKRAPHAGDDEFRAFKRVFDRRNDILHGNIDPERDKFEVVYFDGKRPLYSTGGDNVGAFYANLERHHDPKQAVADYEAVHAFIAYLLNCLEPRYEDSVRMITEDSYPGWNLATNRPAKLFPDHFVAAYFGVRYDDELVDD